MDPLHLALLLAIATAVGHSILSERMFLRPLRREGGSSVLSSPVGTRLSTAMFHLASLCWASLGVCLLVLSPEVPGDRAILWLFAGVFALSGLGNFWAAGRPHPGGVLLFGASAAILFALS
ncbi:MAG: hypothetical protein QNK05_09775 [Myxococcota bacterium]|nr:hypothetical protein [Myxococcota bacterium]